MKNKNTILAVSAILGIFLFSSFLPSASGTSAVRSESSEGFGSHLEDISRRRIKWGTSIDSPNDSVKRNRSLVFKGKIVVNLEGSRSESWGIRVEEGPERFEGEVIGIGSYTEMEEKLEEYRGKKVKLVALSVQRSWEKDCFCSFTYCITDESLISISSIGEEPDSSNLYHLESGETAVLENEEAKIGIKFHGFWSDTKSKRGVKSADVTLSINGEEKRGVISRDSSIRIGEYKVSFEEIKSVQEFEVRKRDNCAVVSGSRGVGKEESPGYKPSGRTSKGFAGEKGHKKKVDSIEGKAKLIKEIPVPPRPPEPPEDELGPCEDYYSEGEVVLEVKEEEFEKEEYMRKFEEYDFKKGELKVAFTPWTSMQESKRILEEHDAGIIGEGICSEKPTSKYSSENSDSPSSCIYKYKWREGFEANFAKVRVKKGEEKEIASKLFENEKVLFVEPVRVVQPLIREDTSREIPKVKMESVN